jgi:hypothetical protein
MGVYPELEHLDLQMLIQRWYEPAIGGDEYAIAYYDELAFLICNHSEAGIAFLSGEIANSDTPRLSAILAHLPPNHSALQSIHYLQDDRPLIVSRTIDRLQAEQIGALEQVLALKAHPSPLVRSSVLRFVSKQSPQSAPNLLIEALHDPDDLVRMSAVDELDELPCVEAIPYIQTLLTDPHKYVQEAAATAIKNLNGLLSSV